MFFALFSILGSRRNVKNSKKFRRYLDKVFAESAFLQSVKTNDPYIHRRNFFDFREEMPIWRCGQTSRRLLTAGGSHKVTRRSRVPGHRSAIARAARVRWPNLAGVHLDANRY